MSLPTNNDGQSDLQAEPWKPLIKRTLVRSVRQRCPHCGEGAVFAKWGETAGSCSACKYEYEKKPGDTYGYIYIQAAIVTFVFLIGMYWYFWSAAWPVRLVYFGLGAAVLIGSIPLRKSVAIGIDYLLRLTDINDEMPDLPPETKP